MNKIAYLAIVSSVLLLHPFPTEKLPVIDSPVLVEELELSKVNETKISQSEVMEHITADVIEQRVLSGYEFSPQNSLQFPIVGGNQEAKVKFNMAHDINNRESIIISIPESLVRDSKEITVISEVVSKGSVTLKEGTENRWEVELIPKNSSVEYGDVTVRFYLPRYSSGTQFSSEIVIFNPSDNTEYIRDMVYVYTAKANKTSAMQNSITTAISEGPQFGQGRNTLTSKDIVLGVGTKKIGHIFSGDPKNNAGGVSVAGPLLDEDDIGSETEGVVIEDILPEGIELAVPDNNGGLEAGALTKNGFGILVTKLKYDPTSQNYSDVSSSWETQKLNFKDTTDPSPKEHEIYVGQNEDGRTIFRANLGTVPADEKWTVRYYPKITEIPPTGSLVYPEFINECFVSTAYSRENQLEPLHDGTWQTLPDDQTQQYYKAELKVDKEETRRNELVSYNLDLEYLSKQESILAIDINVGTEAKVSNIVTSSPNLKASYKDGKIHVTGTLSAEEVKESITYTIDPANLPLGDEIENSFTVMSTAGIGNFYQGNTVKTKVLSEVEARYIDEISKEIIETEVLYGRVGTKYETKEKSFPDYEISQLPENNKGSYSTDRQVVIYQYKPLYAILTIQLLDQDGENIAEKYTIQKKLNEEYNIEEPETPEGYMFVSSENATGIADKPAITVTFSYQGLLYFKEVPTTISFGKNTISKKNDVLFATDYLEHLIIQDNRTSGNTWSVVATITKDFQGASKKNLNNELHYVDGNVEHDLKKDEVETIHMESSLDHEPVDLSNEWDGKHGLELKLKPDSALAEVYFGEVTWILRDVPL